MSHLLLLLLLPSADAKVDYARDVRPILADNCGNCHGPDDGTRKGKLRLDTRDHAIKGGKSGVAALVPNKPDESELIKRLTAEGSELMPPASSGKKLSPKQIETLRKWVAQGGTFEVHWAYVAPKRPPVPDVKNRAWVRNPIDAFVLARLEREGMSPSSEASRETLARRLSLDLVGLPPSLPLLDRFVADARIGAYERLASELLASPHHGERWGRHWLDAARYADSDGYEKDKPRTVWMYRDWVVDALNADMPYDRFVMEQIAGDRMTAAGQGGKVATGFLRNSMINEEGGIDPEQFRMEAMFDRMDAIGKAVLGLGIGCAQCHTHKYDPITHEDYYRLFAYLNNTHEAHIAAYAPADLEKRTSILRRVREIEDDMRHKLPDAAKRQATWEAEAVKKLTPWTVVKVANEGENAQRYVTHDDGSLTAWGYAPTKWTAHFTGATEAKRVTAFRLETLTDENLPLGGPGRSPSGLFALSEFEVEYADPKTPGSRKRVKLVRAEADFANDERPLEAMYDDRTKTKRTYGPISHAIDGNANTAWGIDAGPGRRNVDRKAVFYPEKPLDLPNGAVLTFHLRQNHGGWNSDDNQNNNLGRFRLSVTGVDAPKLDPLPRAARAALSIPADKRSQAQNHAVFSAWRLTVPEWKAQNDEIERLWKTHPVGSAQLALTARDKPRQTFMLERGDFLKPSKAVTPGTPGALHALPKDAPADRLSLAKWLVDPKSPTTARAIVNRVWQAYFGTGLVATSEDLGVQSTPPTHPELLDWLAVEFMESGWSLKHLHRLIVTSATYRQSSAVTEEHLRRDPDNRLLARAPRFRVEGEIVRDIALSAAGLLTAQVGGPPAFPPAPAFLFVPPSSYGPKVWNDDGGPGRYRRAMYTFRFRSVPYPVLANFDTPNADASCIRRPRSNTPLQALTTLNETLFLEAARAMAREMVSLTGTDARRLETAFRRCTGRVPTADEAAVLRRFLERQEAKFSSPGAKPWDLAADDPANPPALPAGVTAAKLAAWTAAARLVLNLDETITRE